MMNRGTRIAALLCLLVGCKAQGDVGGEGAQAAQDQPEGADKAASAHAADQAATGKLGALGGSYNITQANNPGGQGGYSGSVLLARQGEHYVLTWTIPNSPVYTGVGIESGNLLGVGWGIGGSYGVVVYDVDGGNLTGRWSTAQTMGKLGTENLEGPPGLNGKYTITVGKNPNGSSYGGSVTITPTGSTHQLEWNVPPRSYHGVGILEGNTFVVGWSSGARSAGVVLYQNEGGKLNGRWASPKGSQLGMEKLAKL